MEIRFLLSILVASAVQSGSGTRAAEPGVIMVRVRSDSEAPGYEAYRALDGDPRTMWHTGFGSQNPGHPHEIVIDLGAPYDISGIAYQPRADPSQNGTIRNFELHVSNREETAGEPVAVGSFGRGKREHVLALDRRTRGRYVRLRALSEVHGKPWTSIAELRILSSGPRFLAVAADGLPVPMPRRMTSPGTELEIQYEALRGDIRERSRFAAYAAQTSNQQSLILDSDRDPLDVVSRRTGALLKDLAESLEPPARNSFRARLAALRSEAARVDVADADARLELFEKVCALRREIAFANPLLDFDQILFLKRHRPGFDHMCDQYYGIHARSGGGLFVLSDPFGPAPRPRDVLSGSIVQSGRLAGQELRGGSYLSPDLSRDGQSIVFAYVECRGDRSHRSHTDPSRGHWSEGWSYHLFRAHVDGSGLEQLTDGTWNDFDPCWLPGGRVAFISERRGGYLRCGRVCPTYTLHDMSADGTDIRCLSPHETNEWHPSVNHDGLIVYTRWDYVDRHGCTAHLPWITTPDGRNSRAIHGNFAPRERRPDMELDVRAIPGSRKYVATAAPHHGQAFGSLVIIDPAVEDDDAMAPVTRLTPEVAFPETQGGAQVYGTAWPLSETYFLCAYDVTMTPGMGRQGGGYQRGNYGIYLVDAFGNQELIYRDPDIACQNPVPLRARKRPPVIPARSERVGPDVEAEGTLAVLNVYDSLRPWPEGTTIAALRVFQILPMTVPSGAPPHEIGLRLPTGTDSVILARHVLGTVPVEQDGSAYFTVPARKEIFFQALDRDGLAIQSMRSATYVQPGEQLVCQGCHEPPHRAPRVPRELPMALRRGPSRLEPDVEGSRPFSYPRLVQPVLDRQCVPCHEENADSAPRLDDEVVSRGRQRWYASYFSLAPEHGFWQYGERHRTTPGLFGARASKLYELLRDGKHHGLELPAEDMHRITLWLDSCSVFYGVYEKEGGEAQLRGEVVRPTLE